MMMPTPIVISTNISRKYAYWRDSGMEVMSPNRRYATPMTARSAPHTRNESERIARPPADPGVIANAPAVTTYAAARRKERGAAQPTAGVTGNDERSQAAARMGMAQSISIGRDTGCSSRNLQTPRRRKKTCASIAATWASSNSRGGGEKGDRMNHSRNRLTRKNAQDAIQSRNGGRRNLR